VVAGPAGGCKPGRWPGVRLGLPDCAPARRMDGLARGARLRCGSRTGGEKSGGFRSVPAPSQKRRLRDRPLWSCTIATGREIRWRRTDRGFVLKLFGLRPATSLSDEKRPETTPTSPLIHRFEIYFGGLVAFALGHAHQERGVGGDGEGPVLSALRWASWITSRPPGGSAAEDAARNGGRAGFIMNLRADGKGHRTRARPFCSRSGRLTLSRAVEADPVMGCLDLGLAAVGCHARRLVKPGICGIGTFLGA
jgi:hypothetical protein